MSNIAGMSVDLCVVCVWCQILRSVTGVHSVILVLWHYLAAPCRSQHIYSSSSSMTSVLSVRFSYLASHLLKLFEVGEATLFPIGQGAKSAVGIENGVSNGVAWWCSG